MDDNADPEFRKPKRQPDHVSLQDLHNYYLDRVDQGKREVIEAQLADPASDVSGALRWLRRDWSVENSVPAPDFPRLADLPQEETDAAVARRRFALRTSDLRPGFTHLRRPEARGQDRPDGGKGRY